MRFRFMTGALALVFVGATAFVGANPVVKSTVKDPTSTATSAFVSPIGAGVKIQGPGSFASVTAAAAAFFSFQTGTLNKTAEGTSQLVYTHDGTDTHYKLFSSVIGGFQFCWAKKMSSGGSGTCTNTLTYNVAKVVDGVSSIGLSGSQTLTSAANATTANQTQYKPLFKFTGGLLVLTSGATVTTTVSSHSTIDNVNNSFTGAANGQAIGFNFGT